jgi:hypothetical protein
MNKNDIGKLNSKCSRGYCGYFTTKRHLTKMYLRSMKEFIVASWLSNMESDRIKVFGEWYIGEYRPDFRVEINGKIRLVVEVKDNKLEAERYITKYKSIINSFGYRYIVVYKNSHFSKLIKSLNLNTDDWKKNSIYDYCGENNPRFGMAVTEETKKKIGDKTTERCKNPEYRAMLGDRVRKSYTEEKRKEAGARTKYHAKLRKDARDIEDPHIAVSCVWCGKEKVKRKSKTKEVEFCDARCSSPYYKAIGKSRKFTTTERFCRMKKAIFNFALKIYEKYGIISVESIFDAKASFLIHNTAQISEKSIIKYYLNFETLNEEIKIWQN